MAEYSRVTPEGWSQGDDATDQSRVTPDGWAQIAAVVGPITPTLSAATFFGSTTSTGWRSQVTAS